MRIAIRLLTAICIAVLLLFVGGAIWLYLDLQRSIRSQPPQPPLPALLRGLDGNVEAARKQFEARVQRRFPAGTDAATMRRALQEEGFVVRASNLSGTADFERHSIVCVTTWIIAWHAGPGGKVQDVEGITNLGCL